MNKKQSQEEDVADATPCSDWFKLDQQACGFNGIVRVVLAVAMVVTSAVSSFGGESPGIRVDTLFEPGDGANFGSRVSTAGDFNGDGIDDLLVGVPEQRDSGVAGRQLLFLGSRQGIAKELFFSRAYAFPKGRYGWAIAGVGDLDGDGKDEVAIGVPELSSPETMEGGIYLYRGQLVPRTNSYWKFVESDQRNVQLGFSLSGGWDITGDGVADLAIGVPKVKNKTGGQGRVVVYSHFAGEGNSGREIWRFDCPVPAALLGESVTMHGDCNGDGWRDLAVGGSGELTFSASSVTAGIVYVFLGGAAGLSNAPTWSIHAPPGVRHFGRALAWVDSDGDAVDELVVGAPGGNGSAELPGAVFAYAFSTNTSEPKVIWSKTGMSRAGRFGQSLTGVGDINGDGKEDLLVGAPYARKRPDRSGCAYLFLGKRGGFLDRPGIEFEGPMKVEHFGYSLAGGFDLNGDGVSDMAIGSPNAGRTNNTTGRIDVIYGTVSNVWHGFEAEALENGGVTFREIIVETNVAATTINSSVPVPQSLQTRGGQLHSASSESSPSSDAERTRKRTVAVWLWAIIGIGLGTGIVWILKARRKSSMPVPVPSALPDSTSTAADMLHDELSGHFEMLRKEMESGGAVDMTRLRHIVNELQLRFRRILGGDSVSPKSPAEVADSLLELVQVHHPPNIKWRCVSMEGLSKTRWDVETTREVELALGEILLNAFQHSDGKLVEIDFVSRPDCIEFWIANDGSGLPEDAAKRGRGLASVSRRAASLDGWFRIGNRDGGGVEAVFCVPVESEKGNS